MAKLRPLAASLALSLAACGMFMAHEALAADSFSLLVQTAANQAAAQTPAATQVRQPVAQPTDKPAQPIIPFEQAGSNLRLWGEDDRLQLTFAVSAEQAARGGMLSIAYTNAVSVMPENGRMEVFVNGGKIGEFSIRSPLGVETRAIMVPADKLKAGRNQVTLRAYQHHRVDCSLQATYELWTDLDRSHSGFVPAVAPSFRSMEDLLQIGRDARGMTNIHLRGPAEPGPAELSELARISETLALYLNRDDIHVTYGNEPVAGPGIDVAMAIGASQLSITPEGKDRALVTLSAPDVPGRHALLLSAMKGEMRRGFETGVLAPRAGLIKASADGTYTLANAGYHTAEFSGRLARVHFDLQMPEDFYPADYDSIRLTLNAATAPGLKSEAQLLVRVNDRVISSYPFRNRDGETFREKPILLPLRDFRPGLNHVELLAELPTPADQACAPEARNEQKPRFILLESTGIAVPKLARIARLPDLAALVGTGYPFTATNRFALEVLDPTPAAINAALTMTTRLSMAAGKPLSPDFTFQPAPETGHILSISTAGLPGKVAPQIDHRLDRLTTSAIPGGPFTAKDEDQLLAAFQSSVVADGEDLSLAARSQGQLGQAVHRFLRWLSYDQSQQGQTHVDDTGVMARLSQMETATGSRTVLSARDETSLLRAIDRIEEPTVWRRLEGGDASVMESDGSVVVRPADSRFVTELTDPGPGNLRRLLAAWFSDHFPVYVAIVFALTVGFGLLMARIVPRVGVRTDQ